MRSKHRDIDEWRRGDNPSFGEIEEELYQDVYPEEAEWEMMAIIRQEEEDFFRDEIAEEVFWEEDGVDWAEEERLDLEEERLFPGCY